jgi:hypothetical protein
MNDSITLYTKLTPTRFQRGTVQPGNYTFEARVFREPSGHGINQGEVSILEIRNAREVRVALYHREWVEMPTDGAALAAVKLIADFYSKNARNLPDVIEQAEPLQAPRTGQFNPMNFFPQTFAGETDDR